ESAHAGYRRGIEKLLHDNRTLIDSDRAELAKIRALLTDPDKGVKIIGLGISRDKLEEELRQLRSPAQIEEILKARGVTGDVSKMADELCLMVFGPVLYLKVTNDPAINGMTLVGMENGNIYEKMGSLIMSVGIMALDFAGPQSTLDPASMFMVLDALNRTIKEEQPPSSVAEEYMVSGAATITEKNNIKAFFAILREYYDMIAMSRKHLARTATAQSGNTLVFVAGERKQGVKGAMAKARRIQEAARDRAAAAARQAAGQRSVYVEDAFHKSPVAQSDLRRTIDQSITGTYTAAQYVKDVEKLYESHKDWVERAREDVIKIVTMFADPASSIKTIGLEYSQQELDDFMKIDHRAELAQLIALFKSRGLSYPEVKARDFYLMLRGPVGYLLATNDASMQGIKLVAIDSREYRDEHEPVLRAMEEASRVLGELYGRNRGVTLEGMEKLNSMREKILRDDTYTPGESEMAGVLFFFDNNSYFVMGKDRNPREVARSLLELTMESRRIAGLREKFMASRIRENSSAGNVAVFVGSKHMEGIGRWVRRIGGPVVVADQREVRGEGTEAKVSSVRKSASIRSEQADAEREIQRDYFRERFAEYLPALTEKSSTGEINEAFDRIQELAQTYSAFFDKQEDVKELVEKLEMAIRMKEKALETRRKQREELYQTCELIFQEIKASGTMGDIAAALAKLSKEVQAKEPYFRWEGQLKENLDSKVFTIEWWAREKALNSVLGTEFPNVFEALLKEGLPILTGGTLSDGQAREMLRKLTAQINSLKADDATKAKFIATVNAAFGRVHAVGAEAVIPEELRADTGAVRLTDVVGAMLGGVERYHFRGIVDDVDKLWTDLVNSGYITDQGIILIKLENENALVLGEEYKGREKAIFDVLNTAYESPVELELTDRNVRLAAANAKIARYNRTVDVGAFGLMQLAYGQLFDLFVRINIDGSEAKGKHADLVKEFNRIKHKIVKRQIAFLATVAYFDYLKALSDYSAYEDDYAALVIKINELDEQLGRAPPDKQADLKRQIVEIRNMIDAAREKRILAASKLQIALNKLPEVIRVRLQNNPVSPGAYSKALLEAELARYSRMEGDFMREALSMLIEIQKQGVKVVEENAQGKSYFLSTNLIASILVNAFPWIFNRGARPDPAAIRMAEAELEKMVMKAAEYDMDFRRASEDAMRRLASAQMRLSDVEKAYSEARQAYGNNKTTETIAALNEAKRKMNDSYALYARCRLEALMYGVNDEKLSRLLADVELSKPTAAPTTMPSRWLSHEPMLHTTTPEGGRLVINARSPGQVTREQRMEGEGYVVEMVIKDAITEDSATEVIDLAGERRIQLENNASTNEARTLIHALEVRVGGERDTATFGLNGTEWSIADRIVYEPNKQLRWVISDIQVSQDADGNMVYSVGTGFRKTDWGFEMDTGVVIGENETTFWIGGRKVFQKQNSLIDSFSFRYAGKDGIISVEKRLGDKFKISFDVMYSGAESQAGGEICLQYSPNENWSFGLRGRYDGEELIPIASVERRIGKTGRLVGEVEFGKETTVVNLGHYQQHTRNLFTSQTVSYSEESGAGLEATMRMRRKKAEDMLAIGMTGISGETSGPSVRLARDWDSGQGVELEASEGTQIVRLGKAFAGGNVSLDVGSEDGALTAEVGFVWRPGAALRGEKPAIYG
ncbi:MAG: hypothetical protein ABH885_08530, partial [Candidatus Omnitrophota bacterium]